MCVEIKLTRGFIAIIDAEDLCKVLPYKWSTTSGRSKEYAQSAVPGAEKKTVILMHRLILGFPNRLDVDHINGNGLDNRKCNLRVCNRSQNMLNRAKANSNSLSGVTGVSFDKSMRKWCVKITIDGKYKHLGYYVDKDVAIQIRRDAELKYYREFAPIK